MMFIVKTCFLHTAIRDPENVVGHRVETLGSPTTSLEAREGGGAVLQRFQRMPQSGSTDVGKTVRSPKLIRPDRIYYPLVI